MLNEIACRVSRRKSFAFETTLAGLGYARHVRAWRKAGYHVKLIFLSLNSADLAVARVAARVAQGGHNIPEKVIRRRFAAGLRNFNEIYSKLVTSWILYDNSSDVPTPVAAGDNA